ncbi:DNA recombination protein RmuC [Nocardioides currus]|uniref:DNA recombination protein RmuC n=1 Tax=Nocardioides currus TaxID=2133958 RepID=A0A2R7Z3B2_9ACTN|nr:DNA recombination protein RmuC [Nocardioides currus]PUA83044.1 DNA recombination protein RmuC [Nocardioides currus]
MEILTILVMLGVGLALGFGLGWLASRARPRDEGVLAALTARGQEQAVLREGLDRLGDQLRDLDHDRATWQGQFSQQVSDMRLTTESLRRETSSLATALRKPQVRGRWGELHLRRAIELAGLVSRCDFTEQAQLADGVLRPDVVVHLAGGKSVVIDAKVSLEAFLDAASSEDDDEREAHLQRHVRQLRTHVDQLAAKAYWRSLDETPEFVVMFVPAEAFLSAALDTQADLLEHAASKHVILATPTTLIALLRTVAHGWSHETLAAQASEVRRLGAELHQRLGSLGAHLDKLGRSLGAAVTAYNAGVGSLEGRVLVTARRFTDLGVTTDELAAPRQVEEAPRSLSAPELDHDDFAALGDLARPGPSEETLFDDSATRPAPRPDEPRIRRA